MNRDNSSHQSAPRKQHSPEELSLRGYYTIGAFSVCIGIVIGSILNLATPLQIVTERLADLSQPNGSVSRFLLIPPILYLLLLVGFSLIAVKLILRPISQYLGVICSGRHVPEGLAENARRRLLYIPFLFFPANMVMWIVPLGIESEWNYTANRKEGLEEGQIIVLGTAGILEAQNSEGGFFGKIALQSIIRNNSDASAKVLLDMIIGALDRFRDGFTLQDDVTLVVVKIGEA